MTQFNVEVVNRLSDIDGRAWNALLPDNNPFLRHEFLSGLEQHGCISTQTGWIANHFIVKNDKQELIAALPAYLKTNSFGEFVFDWSWASAYEDAGFTYYPKLISAVPYTPVTGPRLLIANNENIEPASQSLLNSIIEFTEQNQLSSFHCLFPTRRNIKQFSKNDMLIRTAYQYHWENREYESFEHYLSFFRSRKRKNINRERRLVKESNITLHTLHGEEMTDKHWQTAYRFYQSTFLKKGNYPALTIEFFKYLSQAMPHNLVIIFAEHKGELIAAAINLKSDTRLYGRYWGSEIQFQNLHFEVCFYAGIEYCINNNLHYFEPGAQGEHKITRGFLPVETYSTHWIANPQFRVAIADFLEREKLALAEYKKRLDNLSPFRNHDVL